MKTSAQGRKAIAKREGSILHVYKDSKGLPTAGIGHLLSSAEKKKYPVGTRITQEMSDAWLEQDLAECEAAVNAVGVSLKANEFDALVSLAFNIGVAGFNRSTVVRRLKVGNKKGAGEAILMWNKPPEIKGRRRTEYVQFHTPYASSAAAPLYDPSQNGITGGDAVDTSKTIDNPANQPPPIVPLVPDPQPVIPVEEVKAATESPIDTTITKWSARFVAIPTAVLTFAGGLWSTLTSTPEAITITLIVGGLVIAGVYFLAKMVINSRDKARSDQLQAEREARAHEIQILTLKSASDPNLNAVKIVSPPAVELQNSDNPVNAGVTA